MYRVLIVEDEEVIRKGIIFMMDWESVDCLVVGDAEDGQDGLEKIRQLQPDIVICDIRMPVLDGLEMLKASIGTYGYSAVILSGYQDFRYAQTAIRLGVKEYLLKPLDFEELKQSLQSITKQIEAQKRRRALLQQAADAQEENSVLEERWLTQPAGGNRYVRAMLEHVKEYYSTHVSLTELSQELGVSAGYLNAKFKEHTQYTFNDFLNRYRVSKAVALMREPNNTKKVYEIAEAVGYRDYKYFIKVFKKYVGSSPLKFASLQPIEEPAEGGGRK